VWCIDGVEKDNDINNNAQAPKDNVDDGLETGRTLKYIVNFLEIFLYNI
jgi:hypothetical protein